MKKKRFSASVISVVILLSIINLNQASAQDAAAPFLQIPPSAVSASMGESGVAYSVNDPLHSAMNPANLGFISENSNFGFSVYPEKIQLNTISDDILISNWGFYAGHGFGEIFEGGKLSAGAGFLWQEVDLGTFVEPFSGDTYNPYENASTVQLAAMLDWCVDVGIGMGVKFIKSELNYNGDATAIDLGILIRYPIFENVELSDKFKFNLDVNGGYSLLNLGDEMRYDNNTNEQLPFKVSDPLPRLASLGYSINAVIDMSIWDDEIKAVDILWTAEARDLLVKRDSLEYEYMGPFGGIRPISDIFALDRSDVNSMYGYRITLFETAGFSGGVNLNIHFGNIRDVNTRGIFLSTAGPGKILAEWTDSPVIRSIADHAELNYMYAEYLPEGDQLYHYNRYYNQLWLVVKNFDLF